MSNILAISDAPCNSYTPRFTESDATITDEKYYAALAANEDLGRTRGIDAVLKEHALDAIILPTAGRDTSLQNSVKS